ncbi:hypothetical protein [Actinomadura sp. B10D3]|uniref:hypothetical protein n=1 Tax=Actinomadura sp. B10D3 TaxID=3153557 RepID=UPI00325FDBB6
MSVFRTGGTVDGADAVLKGRATRLSGAGSSVTLDFGTAPSATGLSGPATRRSPGPADVQGGGFAGTIAPGTP